MRLFLIVLLLLWGIASSSALSKPKIPLLYNGKMLGYSYSVFRISENSPFRVVVAASNTGTSLKDLVAMRGGVGGMNGAYFIPHDYSKKGDESTTIRIMNGEAKAFSKYYPDTGINGIFGFTASGAPLLVQNNLWWERSLRANYNSGRIEEIADGIANFPILLIDGKNALESYRGNPVITNKLIAKGTKAFICRTSANAIIMGSIKNIGIFEVPEVLTMMKCREAINLDSWGSLAMFRDGKYVVGPGRNILDAFVIVQK